jgi:hypothetical protein
MTQPISTFDPAVAAARLEAAILAPGGGMVGVDRVELEALGRDQVRWTLFGADGRRLHSLTGRAEDLPGFCAATQIVLGERLREGPSHASTAARP